MDKSLFNFNKEILFGEIGAVVGAPLIAFFTSFYTGSFKVISASAVVGAILGAAVFWIGMRIYDKRNIRGYDIEKFGIDLLYFTPIAFLLTLSVYYPFLYFFSKLFMENGEGVFLSVIPSQILAFFLFLMAINIYRHLLLKYTGRKL